MLLRPEGKRKLQPAAKTNRAFLDRNRFIHCVRGGVCLFGGMGNTTTCGFNIPMIVSCIVPE